MILKQLNHSENTLNQLLERVMNTEKIQNKCDPKDPKVGICTSRGTNNGKDVFQGKNGGLYTIGWSRYANIPIRNYITDQIQYIG